LIQGSHAAFYVFGALHWRSIGISDNWIGVLWALGVVAEIALFSVSNQMLQHFGAFGLIVIGGAAAVVRWFLLALEPSFWILFPIQGLHALTFAATHLGTVSLIQTHISVENCGAAQSAYAAFGAGALMALATLIAGLTYETLGSMSYIIMAGLAAIGLVAAMFIRLLDKNLSNTDI